MLLHFQEPLFDNEFKFLKFKPLCDHKYYVHMMLVLMIVKLWFTTMFYVGFIQW